MNHQEVLKSIYDLSPLTPIQKLFLQDEEHRFQVTCSGRRSRKTLIGRRKTFLRALERKGRYFHGAPTHKQAKSIFWDDLKRYTKYLRRSKSESDLWVKLINGSEIHVVGLDAPERIEGQPWHGCHLTEFGNFKPNAWESNIRPVLSDTNGWAIIDGVPEGRAGGYYPLCLYACGGALPERNEAIKGAIGTNVDDPDWIYYHWFSSDVLPASEIAAARRTLDDRMFRQEYEGSFESTAGLAYYAFSATNLKRLKYDPQKAVYVGMDFNVDPMSAVFFHIENDTILQFGEAYLRHSNTYEMRDEIKSRFPVSMVTIFPDSTGEAESSKATKSDLAILRLAGFKVKAHKSNPKVKDRINAVNARIRTTDGQIHYFVDPVACPYTVKDLNMVERLPDGRENKKQEDEGLVHISSALGYPIAYMYPVRSGTYGVV